MRAKLLRREKETDADGDLLEEVVWEVPKSPRNPEGVRYRLAFIPAGYLKPAILYDNHHPKGPHVHRGDREDPYLYRDVERLAEDFLSEVAAWRRLRGKMM